MAKNYKNVRCVLVTTVKARRDKANKMKRFNGLYGKIISVDNLIEADRKARKGKLRSYGVQRHDKLRGCNILLLHNMLAEQSYKTSKYETFLIEEPKEREIFRLPYYPDRIVHHAVMNIMEPIWVSIFNSDTYSCIKGRGIHAAVKKVKEVLISDPCGTRYCLKLDVKKFYQSIDHDILKQIVRRKIKDKDLLRLLDEVIDSAPGVPIGNYLSQYFANLYLAYFDHWIKETKGIKHYFRYADDIVVFAGSKGLLHALLAEIRQYLTDNLKLEIKGNYQVFPVDSRGVDFLGYVFRHKYVLMRKNIKKNFARKAARLRKKGKLTEHALCSHYGWAIHCNSNNLIKKIYGNEIKQSA